jgi:hypothetical protein
MNVYNSLNKLPNELINEIADYIDYEKYDKPKHQKSLLDVLEDILSMSDILLIPESGETLSCRIAWQCWGLGSHN